MKKPIVLLALSVITNIAVTQEYSFPLFFEDAVGNKDTLYFGFDHSATSNIDENLGEINILGQTYDSAFFVFFTDAATSDEFDCRLEFEKKPGYLSKKQYINTDNIRFVEIGLMVNNWPIEVSWNQSDFINFDVGQYAGSYDLILTITSFHPFNGIPDLYCCGVWPSLNNTLPVTILSDTANIILEKNNFCQYHSNISIDSINLLYVGILSKTSDIENLTINKYHCWYNQSQKTISFQNFINNDPLKIEIFNVWGTKLIEKQFSTLQGQQYDLDISHLSQGIYLVRLYDIQNQYLLIYKIMKL